MSGASARPVGRDQRGTADTMTGWRPAPTPAICPGTDPRDRRGMPGAARTPPRHRPALEPPSGDQEALLPEPLLRLMRSLDVNGHAHLLAIGAGQSPVLGLTTRDPQHCSRSPAACWCSLRKTSQWSITPSTSRTLTCTARTPPPAVEHHVGAACL